MLVPAVRNQRSIREVRVGLCKTSNFSIFTSINASDLKFCPRSYSSCVYHMMRFNGSNGNVWKWWRHTSVLCCTHYIESCLSIFSRTLAVPVVFRRIDQSSKVALRSLKIVYRAEQYTFSSTTQFLSVCYYLNWNLFSCNMAAMHIPSISMFFAASTITKYQIL